jgi:hypothetical protein
MSALAMEVPSVHRNAPELIQPREEPVWAHLCINVSWVGQRGDKTDANIQILGCRMVVQTDAPHANVARAWVLPMPLMLARIQCSLGETWDDGCAGRSYCDPGREVHE